MSLFAKPAAGFCPKENTSVPLNQTEGQCRDAHRCSDDPCPLECQFGQDRFTAALDMLAASIGQGLNASQGK
jgi:hypothetical protein